MKKIYTIERVDEYRFELGSFEIESASFKTGEVRTKQGGVHLLGIDAFWSKDEAISALIETLEDTLDELDAGKSQVEKQLRLLGQ